METNFGSARGCWRSVLSEVAYLSGALNRYLCPPAPEVQRLVFVCLGNINRSAFAQALARRRGATAISLGLAASVSAWASDSAVRQALVFGVELRGHQVTDISDYDFRPGDLLVAMEIRHATALEDRGIPVSAIGLLGHWASPHRIHLQDPQGLPDAYFRTCFSLIHSAVDKLLDELEASGSLCIDGSAAKLVKPLD